MVVVRFSNIYWLSTLWFIVWSICGLLVVSSKRYGCGLFSNIYWWSILWFIVWSMCGLFVVRDPAAIHVWSSCGLFVVALAKCAQPTVNANYLFSSHEVPPPPPLTSQGLGREVPLPPPPPPSPPPSQDPWSPSSPEGFGQHVRCEADACRGCLVVCAACTRWLHQPLISSDFTDQLRTLTCAMHMLPASCTPCIPNHAG